MRPERAVGGLRRHGAGLICVHERPVSSSNNRFKTRVRLGGSDPCKTRKPLIMCSLDISH